VPLVLLPNLRAQPAAPSTTLEWSPDGALRLLTPTEPGVVYTLQSTGTLSSSPAWTSAPRQLYGSGAQVALVLVEPASPGVLTPAQFFHISPLSDGGSVVSWSSAGVQYRKVIPEDVSSLPPAGVFSTANLEISWRKGGPVSALPQTLDTALPPSEVTRLQEMQAALPGMSTVSRLPGQ
jgi:hypothetical protein